jgi:DNA helicase IV
VTGEGIPAAVVQAVDALLGEVAGSIAVISPARWIASIRSAADVSSDRVNIVDPMSTKGLEYDATVIVDPDEITAESPGGVRVLYVALTRAAHRMTVLELER